MCYHRWKITPESGTTAHMKRKCYRTRSAANKFRLGEDRRDYVVLKCRYECPCDKFKQGHNGD